MFLSADQERPQLLEAEGLGVAGSRFTYAVGVLVLWSADAARVNPAAADAAIAALVAGEGLRHVAIANPETAPYGLAAQQTLQALGIWERLQGRLVRGQDVSQTLGFAVSGGAELAFVPLSLVSNPERPLGGAYWRVPERLHGPIRQDAVLLARGAGHAGARAFLAYLRGDAGQAVVRAHGYASDPGPLAGAR